MSRTKLSIGLAFLGLFWAGALRAEDEWGTLTGKFIYDGQAPAPKPAKVDKDVETFGQLGIVDEWLLVDSNGGLANVVIYVKTKDVKVHPDIEANIPATVSFDNNGGKFVPHVLPIWYTKQKLVLSNSDPVGHNSNVQPLGDNKAAANPLLPPQGSQEIQFSRPQTVGQPVVCNIHPWMKGWLLPRDNPYTAVSGADGTFRLENLPAGELEFHVWHEEKPGHIDIGVGKKGKKKGDFIYTIQPGENDLGEIRLAPKLFQ